MVKFVQREWKFSILLLTELEVIVGQLQQSIGNFAHGRVQWNLYLNARVDNDDSSEWRWERSPWRKWSEGNAFDFIIDDE